MKENNFELEENSAEDKILNMLESFRVMREVGLELAKVRKQQFDNYIAVGFTEEQALKMVSLGI